MVACVASGSNRVIARKVDFFCSRPNFSRRTRAETLATQATWMATGSLVFRLMKHLCLTYLVENLCWTPVVWCYRVRKLIKRNDQLSVVMLTSGRQYTTCLRLPTPGNEKKYCDTVDTSLRRLSFPFPRVSFDGRFDYLIKTLFTWSGGPRSDGVGFFCFVSPRAWKQKKQTPLDRGPPLHVNRP